MQISNIDRSWEVIHLFKIRGENFKNYLTSHHKSNQVKSTHCQAMRIQLFNDRGIELTNSWKNKASRLDLCLRI